MTRYDEHTAAEYERRRAHIKAHVGVAARVGVRRTAAGEWQHEIACSKCTVLRWWREGTDVGELIAAWLMHEAGHGAELRRRMARDANGERTREDGEQNLRGISHLIALALVVMDLDVVRRSTIRTLLPESGNRISLAARGAYKRFEQAGWITRFEPGLVRVNDREPLFGWVANSQDLSPERAISVLSVGIAAKAVAEESAPAHDLAAEVRLQELRALQRLMEAAPGAVTNKRGRVRVVPKSSAL